MEAQFFKVEYCKIYKNSLFIDYLRWLLLEHIETFQSRLKFFDLNFIILNTFFPKQVTEV